MKTTKRENKSGTVRYLHLAHNEWDPAKGRAVPKVLYTFGREQNLDREAVRRLVASLWRLLEPGNTMASSAAPGLEFASSVPYGGSYVLDCLWRRMRLDQVISRVGQSRRGRRRDMTATERVLFALVANRALAPSSRLAAAEWISHDVHIAGLPATTDSDCYRAMDWLLQVKDELEPQVFREVANLLNSEVELLFFDTTSTSFELDQLGEAYGKPEDSRDDLPQIIIGMAVTGDGIPVRCWWWPGNAQDQVLIRQVKDDMRDWTLAKIVWVTDRGFSSEQNRRYLRQAGHHYVVREKLRSGTPEVKAVLSRQGRYTRVAGNVRLKEVRISDTERFVICHNPGAAERSKHLRDQLTAQLSALISDSDQLSDVRRGELRGKIAATPGLNRYLRVTPGGKLRIDAAAIKAEQNLDGKYLLCCSDPHLPAGDIAARYKHLLEVERGWRDMKQVIDLGPVYHRLEERIRAHVILCWLALLLIRIAETTVGSTWPAMRRELDRLHAGTFTGPAGSFQQLTTPTCSHKDILAKLAIPVPVPGQIIDIQPAARRPAATTSP